ncbi:MAG: ribosome silencing factor [Deltaproteobacteria bacterium]|nr:ribosome silencing factor [Deltaproteobacteria bacterium]
MVVTNKSDTKKTVLKCTNAALDKKAKNLIILKVKELSSFTDYFIICSGTSDRQVKGIAASIEETLKKSGIQPLGIEGENTGNWVLMDYGDVIIHIFYEPTREFYDLERLWSDVPSMSVNEDIDKITSLNDGM